MSHVVFVATELDPVIPGGAGTVVSELARRLREEGRRVTVVLVTAAAVRPPPGVVVVPPVEDPDASPPPFLSASRAAAEALERLAAEGPLDWLEFQDFHGLGYWTLCHRRRLGLDRVPILIRVHAPADLLLDAVGVAPAEFEVARALERESFGMADGLLVQTADAVPALVARYGLESDRVFFAEPPLPELDPVPPAPAAPPEFVCLGRLGEPKGSDLFLDAALRLLHDGLDARFRFLGPDGWVAASGRSMRAWLAAQVPDELAERVVFQGPVRREALATELATATAVVIPSRYESFCLAAHEARALGHPLILSDLAAFRPYFSEATGAVRFDGTVAGLAAAMARLADPAIAAELAAAPVPTYADPLAPYRRPPPPVRHPRAQAGLATAAWARVGAVVEPPAPPGLLARSARALLRVLPEEAAAALMRVVPQGIKDRFRSLASWPEEQARRRDEAAGRRLAERIAAGAYPELERPDVTVVIPCYNQGPYLDDAIRSVFRQQTPHGAEEADFEIIVVDDGSTDPDTIRILDALDYPRTRLLRQENRGLPAARNAGMGLARGRYLVPLDADDELAPGFLASMQAALESEPEAAYAHCWTELFGDQVAVWVPRPYNPYQLLLSNSLVGCVLMRRTAWEAVGGYDEAMIAGNEDWDLWLRFLAAGYGQVEVAEPLFRYRRHGVSMSVETEARFEKARREMMAAHPDLYRREAMRARKAEWYPLVSVFVEIGPWSPPDLDDLEVVAPAAVAAEIGDAVRSRGWRLRLATGLKDAVAAARGKYFVVGGAGADLGRLAEALEEDEEAFAAATGRTVLWRRWSLLDPRATPDRPLWLGVGPAPGAETFELRGRFPDPRWSPDPADYELPLLRPRPEEEGTLPTWAG